ncbi:MAG: hypothetical protein ACYDHM_02540 [Acidiferrobacterales bacterium]
MFFVVGNDHALVCFGNSGNDHVAETMCLALQDEIRRSDEAGHGHRLHGVLRVSYGMNCQEVGQLIGGSTRTVQCWVHHAASVSSQLLCRNISSGLRHRYLHRTTVIRHT